MARSITTLRVQRELGCPTDLPGLKKHLCGVASGGAGFELHGVAEAFEAVDQSALDPRAIAIVEVRTPQILIEVGSGQEPVGDDQNRMPDSDSGLLSPASCGQAAELRRKIAVLLSGCGLSGLDERDTQP